MSDAAPPQLAVTARCLEEDFGVASTTRLSDLQALDDERGGLARAFVGQRGTDPEGLPGDRMADMATGRVPIYILRFGARTRGLTWHDRMAGRVWLIAAHFVHRSGERSDSYVYFKSLSSAQLRPGVDDVSRVEKAAQAERLQAIFELLPEAMARAAEQPGRPLPVDLAGMRISLTFEPAHPPHARLAIGLDRAEHPSTPSPFSILAIVTAVFGHEYADFGDLPYASDGADELVFEDFVSHWPRTT